MDQIMTRIKGKTEPNGIELVHTCTMTCTYACTSIVRLRGLALTLSLSLLPIEISSIYQTSIFSERAGCCDQKLHRLRL